MLDGLSKIKPLLIRAKELGMDSLGITDHGGLYGAIDFYQTANSLEVKPIIGCEIYVAPNSRHSRSPVDKTPFHCTVLAKNNVGYSNLVKLVTKSHMEGFYYKPRVDRELLALHSEGLIVFSGCPSGEIPSLITNQNIEEAHKTATWYKNVFEDYYLEVMQHGGVPGLDSINKNLIEMGKELDIPLVATNDSHYTQKEDAPIQDVLVCIHTNTNLNDNKRLRMSEDSYYLKNPQEMNQLFSETPEAISNTIKISDSCEINIDFSAMRLPQFQIPDNLGADEYLSKIAWSGLTDRLQNQVTEAHKSRLKYELEVIKQTQYANYCLVVWDIARFVRERDIFFAVRGSAAGSMALFCIGVTDVNPLDHQLIFERFLNVERNEMPDVDMDFQDDRREEVINYVVSKYGREHVAQIITFGTLGAKAAIRDTGRALAIPYENVDRIAKLVPPKLHVTIDDAIKESPELNQIYNNDESVNNLLNVARKLEGTIRHSSTHAAGVVISKDPVDDVVPLQRPLKGDDSSVSMTQYPMGPLEGLGFMKMDFLGLVNLTVLAKTRDLIAQTGTEIILREIPLNDQKTFEMLSKGDTGGVFQLEGTGMTKYIQDLKPTSLSDISAMIALYRPGPMEQIDNFIDRKHGRAEEDYPHPDLEDILKETYGIIVYQDQVLLIVRTFAGYSLGQADVVRKAMGKKIPEIMAKERRGFIEGALHQGYSEEIANKVYSLIEPFAGYAFAKPHAVSYGLISYWTAYMKAHYPGEYMASLLNAYSGNTDKTISSVNTCRKLGIEVLAPSYTRGLSEFSLINSPDGKLNILFGMGAVKNVNTSAIKQLAEASLNHGPFDSIEQMCREADLSNLNKKTLESLIMVGTFDDFGDRTALLNVTDRIIALAQSEASMRNSNQTSMFDLFGDSVPTPLARIELEDTITSDRQKLMWEKELLGLSLTNITLVDPSDSNSQIISFRSDLQPDMEGKEITLRGQVSSSVDRYTKNGRPFKIATLTLMDGDIDVLVWEDKLETTQALWEYGSIVQILGTLRLRGDQISVSCKNASTYTQTFTEQAPDILIPQANTTPGDTKFDKSTNNAISTKQDFTTPIIVSVDPGREPNSANGDSSKKLNIRLDETGQLISDRTLLEDVLRMLMEYLGEDQIQLEIASKGKVVTLEWPNIRIQASGELEKQLSALIGGRGKVSTV